MERTIAAVTLSLLLAAPAAGAQDGKKKPAPAGEAGPFGLPTLAAVKEKCKPGAEQAPKLETIYADAAKSEADTRRRAKESEADRKTTEKYLADGKLEVVLKIKEVLDKGQARLFDELASASPPPAKKKN